MALDARNIQQSFNFVKVCKTKKKMQYKHLNQNKITQTTTKFYNNSIKQFTLNYE